MPGNEALALAPQCRTREKENTMRKRRIPSCKRRSLTAVTIARAFMTGAWDGLRGW